MSDDNQLFLPPSFVQLYTDARQRLAEPISVVRERYEMCEDLASHLVGQAQIQHHTSIPVESEILQRIHAGLLVPAAGVTAPEARWIVTRLAELLEWRVPDLPVALPHSD